MNINIAEAYLRHALTITAALFLLITAFYIPYYDTNFHRANTGAVENATQIHSDLMQYLNEDYFGYERTHLIDSFTKREQAHLKDVKLLIDLICILYYMLSVLLIGLLYYLPVSAILLSLRNAGIAVVVMVALIGAVALINFSAVWNAFHHIFFPQGNWRFPADSLLIQLYPAGYFQAFAQRFGLYALTFGILSIMIGACRKREGKNSVWLLP